MLPLLTKLKDQPEKASQIFVEALTYYQRSSSPAWSNINFLSFLSVVRGLKVIPDWLMHEAALELATHVTRGVERATDADTPEVMVREKLGFRMAFSLLEDLDPEVAASMKKQRAFVTTDTYAEEMDQQNRVSHKTYTDDAEYQRLRAAVDELVQKIISMSEDRKPDSPDMQTAISQAMALAVKQTERALDTAPDESRDIRRNSSLQEVIYAASKINPDVTLHEIEQVSDDELRAYGLVQFASGIGELQFIRETEKKEEARPVTAQRK